MRIHGLLAVVWLGLTATAVAQDRHVLNFRDVDLPVFIEDVAMLTGRTFIIDPEVRGEITVISQTALSPEEIFEVFQSALQVAGYTALPTANGAYKVVPLDNAPGDAPLRTGTAIGESMVLEVFTVRFIAPAAAQRMLRTLLGEGGQIIAERNTNYFLVVDQADNIERIRSLLDRIDKDDSAVRAVRLENLPVDEAAEVIKAIAAEPGEEGGRQLRLSAVPVAKSNTLLLKGPAEELERYLALLADLDQQAARDGTISVVALDHAKAETMAPILTQVANQLSAEAAPGASGLEVSVQFHEETNSLLINAPADLKRTLLDVVGRLDIRQPQVLVEAIIVEVSDTAARQLGLQYVLGGEDIPFSATNFGSSAPNVLAATGALVLESSETQAVTDAAGNVTVVSEPGFSESVVSLVQEAAINSLLGFSGFATGFGGEFGDGNLFGVILTAVDQDTDSNVLSTPSVTTLNNVPARFLVGQEIPITTGEALGTANINAFRTVQRQDVGIVLEVIPQITQGEAIQLEIRQEVSSIVGPVSAASEDLILSKREIETRVLVDDGEILVLGGLIEDNEQISVDKVPLLGDIPLLGRLFRSEGRSRSRTNLMVFLRPTIVRDRQDAQAVTSRKYDFIRGEQILRSGDNSSSLDELVNQVMGRGPLGQAPRPPAQEPGYGPER